MARGSWSYREGSPLSVPGYGGFTDVAHDLSRQPPYQTVTRQAVYSWWKHRDGNGCPDRRPKERDGVTRLLFKLDEMRLWYAIRMGMRYDHLTVSRDDDDQISSDELGHGAA